MSARQPVQKQAATGPQLPRSPGGQLLSGAFAPSHNLTVGGDMMNRSSSAISSISSSSVPLRPSSRRRSTDASGLDYYWSSLAGAGASSSSSSLALSASPGPGFALSVSPAGVSIGGHLNKIKSHGNLGVGRRGNEDDTYFYQTSRLGTSQPGSDKGDTGASAQAMGENPTSRRIYVSSPGPSWSTSSNLKSPNIMHAGLKSIPPGRSDSFGTESSSSDSQYSLIEHQTSKIISEELRQASESFNNEQDVNVMPNAMSSTSHASPYETREQNAEQFRTPVAPTRQERPNYRNPQAIVYQEPRGLSPSKRAQTMPVIADSGSRHTASSRSTPAYLYTPKSATSYSLGNQDPVINNATPRSALSLESDYPDDGSDLEGKNQETIKGRYRRIIPTVDSSKDLANIVNGEQRRSPEKGNRGKSPGVPARSMLRSPHITTVFPVDSNNQPIISSTSMSPMSQAHSILPTITHTPDSPFSSPLVQAPARPDRSPSRGTTPSVSSSASISELTDMLGGAIDEIGLFDSKELPSPTVDEPLKRRRLSISLELDRGLEPAAKVTEGGPMTLTSLPVRGTSLTSPSMQGSTVKEDEAPGAGVASSLPPIVRKASSTSSNSPVNTLQQPLSPTLVHSPTVYSFYTQPKPAAMNFDQIKSLKSPAERALAYAKAINELARTESGLRQWCTLSSSEAHRPINQYSSKMSITVTPGRNNGNHNPLQLSPFDTPSYPRNVSAGSEFPLRADSYAAREISQRVMEPDDQPTAFPANLPYPQLQAHAQAQTTVNSANTSSGSLKPSQSMQSVSSFTSSKRGFFSVMRKTGNSKKESISLGPPSNNLYTGGSVGKKDVRGLPISAPRQQTTAAGITGLGISTGSLSPQKEHAHELGASSPIHNPRVQASLSTPMGPRKPRGGSFTPPPSGSGSRTLAGSIEKGQAHRQRASLDTGLTRVNPSHRTRASLDCGGASGMDVETRVGFRTGTNDETRDTSIGSKGSVPPPLSTEETEGNVRYMADVLPHVEKGILKAYLQRCGGDQMRALGAYLEDEKNGDVKS
ncbi:uncharacterized protein L203_100982 [Cryptococcus depauperatus CBS 7841]|uniref:Uncharacterized protein n=1 Tax=Cryptococcus depauperatus CBS 7841 TaxID=1295531 RepID=A0A1E3I9C4_9TREE|nr:hypothetical protein L203_05183 [Cryptococcus depauperatus CBS 7841]